MSKYKPRAKAASQEDRELYLRNKGWRPADDGWRHNALDWGWPFEDAYDLQRAADADESMGDCVHRALRGEP